MSKMIHAEASYVVNASPEKVYAVFVDYRVAHPAILPRPEFGELIVEKGGHGAGTVFRADVTLFGKTTHVHSLVSEPQPGRLLEETDIETGQYTSFAMEPLKGGTQTRVTIASDFPRTPGIAGFFEAILTQPLVRPLYLRELRNLDEYLRTNSVVVNSS